MDDRPSFDEWYLEIAGVVAKRGDCIRRGVGAVVVGSNRRPRGFGYNGTAGDGVPGCLEGNCPRCLDAAIPSGADYDSCIEIHAEENAIENADWDVDNCTMYITCPPCYMCEEQMQDAGIVRVVWPGGEMTFV